MSVGEKMIVLPIFRPIPCLRAAPSSTPSLTGNTPLAISSRAVANFGNSEDIG
jgi:hypothetical protein